VIAFGGTAANYVLVSITLAFVSPAGVASLKN